MPAKRTLLHSVTALTLLVALACGADPASIAGTPSPSSSPTRPSTVPAASLTGMQSTVMDINATDVAAQTIQPDDLEALLGDVGLAAGVQRTFAGGTGAFSRVVARNLEFETDDGAALYLGWLREHVSEMLGSIETVSFPALPAGALSVRHLPDGCCPKEVPVYLVAWQRGPLVLSVEASGQRARAQPIVPIVLAFDREV
jgi:hypothetical protein